MVYPIAVFPTLSVVLDTMLELILIFHTISTNSPNIFGTGKEIHYTGVESGWDMGSNIIILMAHA